MINLKNWITMMAILTCFASVQEIDAQNTFNLEDAVVYALKNSNNIRLKQIEILDADQNIRELKSIGLPKVSGKIDYQHYFVIPQQPLQDFITPAVINVLNNTVTAQQPIPQMDPETFEFSFFQKNQLAAGIEATMLAFDGSYLAALEAAKLFKNFSSEGMKVTEQNIRANVTKAYLNVLILEKNKETIKKNISNLEKSIFEVSEMYKSGFLEKLDVDRLEVSLLNLNTEYEKLFQVEFLTKNVLKFNMDYPLEEEIVLTESLDDLINLVKVDEFEEVTQIDYTKRAEYKQIEMGMQLNELNVKRLQRGYLPNLFLFANLSETLSRNKLFDGDEPGFLPSVSAGLSINVPIYDGNEKNAQIQRAKLNFEKRKVDLENFQKGVQIQVYNAQLQYINARSTAENRERSLKLAEEIYEKSLIKFREGVGSSLEVSQSESNLYIAQSNYINALYDLISTKTDLEIALGEI